MNAEKDQIIADKEDEIAAREEELNKKEAAIQALKDEITESNEYLADIESTVDEVLKPVFSGHQPKRPRNIKTVTILLSCSTLNKIVLLARSPFNFPHQMGNNSITRLQTKILHKNNLNRSTRV